MQVLSYDQILVLQSVGGEILVQRSGCSESGSEWLCAAVTSDLAFKEANVPYYVRYYLCTCGMLISLRGCLAQDVRELE